MVGRISAVESMGMVDGPGIRTVVFFQGCGLRCRYCHNPETWDPKAGYEISAEALVEKVRRFEPYHRRSGGGVTCSGGEPLLQPDFLLSFLERCRERGIHTALDTAGVGPGRFGEILALTDLVLLDVKHVTPEGFRSLAGNGFERTRAFREALNRTAVPVWLRQVVVPGLTDSQEYLLQLLQEAAAFQGVERIELLPYHRMGMAKYESLGIPYGLRDSPPMDRERVAALQRWVDAQSGFVP